MASVNYWPYGPREREMKFMRRWKVNMNTLLSMLTLSLIYATPIIISALGGLFSERSGVVNIALEGLMTFGGFAGATVTFLLEPVNASLAPWLGILSGALIGALVSLLHAYLSVNLQADQTISGTAINMLALGATVFFHDHLQSTTDRGL